MISRNRSAPTAEARTIECTTSANRTVTCLYSADRVIFAIGAPHSLQNLEFGGSSVPHDPHGSPAVVSARRLLSSTSVSCHHWSTTVELHASCVAVPTATSAGPVSLRGSLS